MEPVTEEEEERTSMSAQSLGGTSTDKSSPGDRDEGGDEESSAPHRAAVGDGKKTAETETPKPHAQPSEPKRARDVDPTIELGEAFEDFTSLPKPKKRSNKKKKPARLASKMQASGPVKIHLATAPVPSTDQAKRKEKIGIPTGLFKRPIRSAFGGRTGELASVADIEMPVPMLTDDEIGAGTFFSPSVLELSDGEDADDSFGRLFGDAEQYAAEFENSLNFYSETHEEQDPVYAAFASAKATERREAALARLEAEETEERRKYEEMVLQKAQRARTEIKAKIHTVRLHTTTKQQKQKEEMQAQFQEKRRHNEARVMQGQQIVVEKQQRDYEKAQAAMRQMCNKGNVSRDGIARKWQAMQQQLQHKASRLQAELKAKAEEMRKKTDEHFSLQEAHLQEHHKKRIKEMEVTIRRFVEKFKIQEEQASRRHSRCFEERMKWKRENVLRKFPLPRTPPVASEESSTSPRSPSKDAVASRDNASPTSRSKSSTPTKKHHHHRHGSSSIEKREHHHSHHRHHHHHHNSHSQDTTNQAYQSAFHDDGGDSILRQKRRKGALGMQSIALQVEVHNEGIVLMPRTANSSGDSKSKVGTSEADAEAKKYHAFFAWGLKARQILHSILCGEVPDGFGWDAIPYNGSMQAGQVRCMVTDMRTSEELASIMRAKAAKEQEGLRTKRRVAAKVAELQEKVQEAQKAVSNALEEVGIAAHERSECVAALKKEEISQKEASKQLSTFKEKASGYFNADGTLSNMTPQEYRERLLAMLDKYRQTLDAHNRSVAELEERVKETKAAESALKRGLSQAKKKAESAENSLQKAIKKAEAEKDSSSSQSPKASRIVAEDEEEDIAKARVGGVLDILRLTADKRRSNLELRRHNNYRIAWKDDEVDAEDWPESLKQSLVMKMQRRRVQITLRPSKTSILSDVRLEAKKWNQNQGADAKARAKTPLEQAIRAEQLLLLSLHPTGEPPRLPPAPHTSSSSERWAEPGWQLALDVPVKEPIAAGILPFSMAARHDSLLETLLPESLSAPGRQTALMMRQSLMRLLCNPLSDLSRASAPAETHPAGLSSSTVIAHNERGIELDPMNVSEEEVLGGYKFVAKVRKVPSASSRKRSSNRGASKERKQGSGAAKRRRTNKAASSKKNKDASPKSPTGTSAAPAETSRVSKSAQNEDKRPKMGFVSGPTSNAGAQPTISQEQHNRHPNMSMRQDSQSQPPAPMQNFSPTCSSQQVALPNQTSRSSVAYPNTHSTSRPGHEKARYQGGEIRTGTAAAFNDGQMVIPQPPQPPQQQRAQQSSYQQQQQQAFYQQQQQQQMYFAAQQQAAQQMQSPMQVPYQPMRMQGQPSQEYTGRAAPIHQMQGRGGAISGGSGQSQPPPPMMRQGSGPTAGMPPSGAVLGQGRGLTSPNDPLYQSYGNRNEQKR